MVCRGLHWAQFVIVWPDHDLYGCIVNTTLAIVVHKLWHTTLMNIEVQRSKGFNTAVSEGIQCIQ